MTNEEFMDDLEDKISEQMTLIKPEILKKFVWRCIYNGEENTLATTQYLNPPLITFNLNIFKENSVEAIRRVISHEIIHVLQPSKQDHKEHEAYSKQDHVNFFKK